MIDTDTLKDWLKTENISPKTEKTSADQFQVECEIQPSLFRPLDGLCRGMPKGKRKQQTKCNGVHMCDLEWQISVCGIEITCAGCMCCTNGS